MFAQMCMKEHNNRHLLQRECHMFTPQVLKQNVRRNNGASFIATLTSQCDLCVLPNELEPEV